jgi:hypothetical protein
VDRFKDKTTAYSLWEAIKATYSETSLEAIAWYFNKIIEVNYNLFKNADKYTSYIQSFAIYLKDLGHDLPEPFIAILLFKGLSSSFDSFSSRKYKEIANELKLNKTSGNSSLGFRLLFVFISCFTCFLISRSSCRSCASCWLSDPPCRKLVFLAFRRLLNISFARRKLWFSV